MLNYQHTIKKIIDTLSEDMLGDLLCAIPYYKSLCEEYPYKNFVVFINDKRWNIIVKLSLMLLGKRFIVVPTTMTNDEIITSLTDTVNSIIITDDILNVKSKNSFFKVIVAFPITILGEEPIPYNDLESMFSNSWEMILYSLDRKKVYISNYTFALLYDNLEANLHQYSMFSSKNNLIYASVDDFFIYHLLYFVDLKDEPYICNLDKEKLDKTTKRVSNLMISYENYKEIWKEVLSLTLQNKILFKWFFNKLLGRIIMFVIIRRFEKYFRRFRKIIVLGLITDPILAEVSEKMRHLKVYNTYGETSSMMAMGISDKPGHINIIPGLKTISVSLKENRKIYYILSNKETISSSNETSQLVMSFRGSDFLKNITTTALFTIKEGYAKFLGYAFKNGVCPAYIESIFNSFPFIKESVLVLWKDNYILLLDIDEAILDANNINYLFFQEIMNGQIAKINKDVLPKAIQIKNFAQVPEAIKRYNRLGLLDKEFLYKIEHFI